ncbi:hypothetical protein DU002_00475 [Corallincola holothuriorum]|uniref:Uncharacterized protein n=1 Tax=Corallincola holothuriorum TaxID=2282215 RepID=A0A368NQV6_9GAMM|nr:hypothetical protein [Corallincola holothuriorum]RCU52480.1 hypothetical protein DU002_00475 [Corallincola holothuriorum]
MKILKFVAAIIALTGANSCALTTPEFTLEQAEYQPYGNFIGKDGDRFLHYKWDTADPIIHYIELAQKVKAPADTAGRSYKYKVKSLFLEIGGGKYTIDANKPWLDAMDDGWDDRFNVTYAKNHNAALSGVAAVAWAIPHQNAAPESMLSSDFPKALSLAEKTIKEVGLNCKIQGFSEDKQYEGSVSFVELYRGVHHYRKFECGDVFIHVLTTIKPDLSSTYSVVKVLSDDTKGSDFPEIRDAYQAFKRWDLNDAASAMSFTAENYSERVTTWYKGTERTFPMMRRKCPCTIQATAKDTAG